MMHSPVSPRQHYGLPFRSRNLPRIAQVVVFGQSFEKGCWTFELEADDDFEPDRLHFGLSRWNDLWLLTTLVYDGEEFDCGDMDTMGKSMECWIDDDSVSDLRTTTVRLNVRTAPGHRTPTRPPTSPSEPVCTPDAALPGGLCADDLPIENELLKLGPVGVARAVAG
jgi:hypothetical protein